MECNHSTTIQLYESYDYTVRKDFFHGEYSDRDEWASDMISLEINCLECGYNEEFNVDALPEWLKKLYKGTLKRATLA